ncbi:PP2C family protein-serine/threonine phosphatase [Paenibacillus guangzhouensis]|uniref:PP2C family protein-serine/threonine phosphatase n=1 Tax=Paenibacillus guangzhouensis TaxID=1473112 RepID=UPI0012675B47|nr:PP2C family serine/threonine-protein phosphatase [Paenibacillus guangzhouensis]
MRWISAARSSAGGRSQNEDSLLEWIRDGKECYIVADGKGTHRGGEVVSSMVTSSFATAFAAAEPLNHASLTKVLLQTHDEVRRAQQGIPTLSQLSSTVVALCRQGEIVYWGHVGDSRLYHLREGRIIEHTRDHSVCQSLVDRGEIMLQDIRFHEDRSQLLCGIGMTGELHEEVLQKPCAVQPGDAFLLCSDGWWEYVIEPEMEIDYLKSQTPVEWLSRMEERIVKHAQVDHDNYSAIAVWVESEPTRE